jgi:fatty acid desaturase
LGVASAVWLGALLALVWSIDWFVGHVHLIAALSLFVCIFVVAVANALRHEEETQRRTNRRPQQAPDDELKAVGNNMRATGDGLKVAEALVRDPRKLDRYAILAWAMVGAAAGGSVLLGFGVISLFLLEIIVALLFALFWMVQTIDRLGRDGSRKPFHPEDPS